MKSLLLLLCTTAAYGQYTLLPQSQYSRGLPVSQSKLANSQLDLMNNPLDEAHEYKGSPYLNTVFVKGVVETSKGKFSGLKMRYDMYADMIEIRSDDSVFMLPPDTSIHRIEIGKTILVARLATARGKSFSSYFTPLESGKLSLFSKMVVSYTPWRESPVDPLGTAPKFQRERDLYFVAIGDGSLVGVQNVKQIIAILPDHQSEMEKFARADDTSFKQAMSLKRFAQQYNRVAR